MPSSFISLREPSIPYRIQQIRIWHIVVLCLTAKHGDILAKFDSVTFRSRARAFPYSMASMCLATSHNTKQSPILDASVGHTEAIVQVPQGTNGLEKKIEFKTYMYACVIDRQPGLYKEDKLQHGGSAKSAI